jgi:hypothetical protein
MTQSIRIRRLPVALVLAAVAALGLVMAVAGASGSEPVKQRTAERLVVRGEDTVKETVTDGPCPGGVCPLELTDGVFRGTIGTGQYDGSIELRVAEGFANGEGGVCAPVSGRIVLGAGSADRLVLGIRGDSCQDGQGDLTQASFTNVAEFVVKYGTGVYAKARGSGLATFLEDASDKERMTLIGTIYR